VSRASRSLVLVGVLLVGCGGDPHCMPEAADPVLGQETRESRNEGRWRSEIALDAGVALNGCAFGDVLPERPGDELVAVGSRGEVFVVWHTGEGWGHELLVRTEGELTQVAVGDVDPSREGVEVVVVGNRSGGEDSGKPGTARLVYRSGQKWLHEEIYGDPRLLHMVQASGGSVFVGGFSHTVHLVERRDGAWVNTEVAKLPGPAKTSTAFREGWAIACQDGSLVHLAPQGADWSTNVLDHRGAGRARLSAAADHLLVADDDGTLALVPGAKPGLPASLQGQARVEVYRSKAKLRGAVLADLDPLIPGLELATCTGDGALVLLEHSAGRWTPRELAKDTHTLHHLARGTLGGLERPVLAAASRGGRLYVAYLR
jgi:hypothetical protein